MGDLLFRVYVIGMLLLCYASAESAAQNAMEAHSHAHELACHVGDDELCKFHHGDTP